MSRLTARPCALVVVRKLAAATVAAKLAIWRGTARLQMLALVLALLLVLAPVLQEVEEASAEDTLVSKTTVPQLATSVVVLTIMPETARRRP